MAGEVVDVALAQLAVDAWDLVGLVVGAGDGAARRRLQRQIAVRVVGVVVRGQDLGQRPALLGEGGGDGGGVRRVDRRGAARGLVVDQHAVIVGQAGELEDCESHDELRYGHKDGGGAVSDRYLTSSR